jgi:hypothetical protein
MGIKQYQVLFLFLSNLDQIRTFRGIVDFLEQGDDPFFCCRVLEPYGGPLRVLIYRDLPDPFELANLQADRMDTVGAVNGRDRVFNFLG